MKSAYYKEDEINNDSIRIIVIADNDADICKLAGRADVLICCGDISDNAILRAIQYYCPETTFAVKGNHDTPLPFPEGIVDIHRRVVDYHGIKIGGFSGCWKYKSQSHFLWTQEEVIAEMSAMEGTHIFVGHNSPSGYHEDDDYVHQGFVAFTDYIDLFSPALFLHGHQHINCSSKRSRTKIISVLGEKEIIVSSKALKEVYTNNILNKSTPLTKDLDMRSEPVWRFKDSPVAECVMGFMASLRARIRR